jgi:hypothetical protein
MKRKTAFARRAFVAEYRHVLSSLKGKRTKNTHFSNAKNNNLPHIFKAGMLL